MRGESNDAPQKENQMTKVLSMPIKKIEREENKSQLQSRPEEKPVRIYR